MKLTYRGNSYEVPASTQPDFNSIEQPKIKLVYRGNTFDYIPCLVICESDKNCPSVNLIYRGNSYERKLQSTTQNQSEAKGARLALEVSR